MAKSSSKVWVVLPDNAAARKVGVYERGTAYEVDTKEAERLCAVKGFEKITADEAKQINDPEPAPEQVKVEQDNVEE